MLGLANINYFAIQNKLEDFRSTKTVSKEEILFLTNKVDSMLSFHSSHPHYLYIAGTVYEWLASQENIGSDNRRLLELNALKNYKDSILNRKNWANSWARIIEINAHLRNFDSEFTNAIHEAKRYGPYSEEVGRVLVFVLLNHWKDMKNSEIEIAIEYLNILIDDGQFKAIYQYALSINQEGFLCGLIELNQNVNWQC